MVVRGKNFMNKIMNDKEQLIEQLVEQMDKVFFYCITFIVLKDVIVELMLKIYHKIFCLTL